MSLSSVKKIASEGRQIQSGTLRRFTSPSNKKKRTSKVKLDQMEAGLLRRIIINFHITEKMTPTVKRLHKKMVDEYGYEGSRETLRKEMHALGFRWKKTKSNRHILMEQHRIRQLRLDYLRKIKKFRQENRTIVFTDETYVHSDYANERNWSDSSSDGLRKPVSKGQRLIIVGAGNESGFVKDSYLRWKSQSKSGDYHDDMNFENYKKWLTEKLLINLPPNSVIVVDNAPYHNKQEEKHPTSASRKLVMQEWLRDRNISFDDTMLRPDLYALIKLHKPRFVKYAIDSYVRSLGHEILRLPPYHPDLNPIELVWAALKQYVGTKNVSFKLSGVVDICDEFFNTYSANQWQKVCDKVIKIEDDYVSKEALFDHAFEEIIINLNDDDDDDDDIFIEEEEDELTSDSD